MKILNNADMIEFLWKLTSDQSYNKARHDDFVIVHQRG